MYLGELNAKQKEKFLDIGICLALADGKFSDEEKNTVRLLCDEMRIEARYTAEVSPEEATHFLLPRPTHASSASLFLNCSASLWQTAYIKIASLP